MIKLFLLALAILYILIVAPAILGAWYDIRDSIAARASIYEPPVNP